MNNFFSDLQGLTRDLLEHIHENYEGRSSLCISSENYDFFAPAKALATTKSAERKVSLPPPVAEPRSTPASSAQKTQAQAEEPQKMPATPAVELKPHTPQAMSKPSIQLEFTEEMRRHIQKVLPHLTLCREIPDDDQASILSEQWKQKATQAKVLLLSFSESKESDTFLHNIKRAIEAHFCSAAVIEARPWEEKNEWEAFFSLHSPSLIIASPELYKTKHLIKYYKENAASKERTLSSRSLLLLLALPVYSRSPEHKKALWNTLCQLLKSPL